MSMESHPARLICFQSGISPRTPQARGNHISGTIPVLQGMLMGVVWVVGDPTNWLPCKLKSLDIYLYIYHKSTKCRLMYHDHIHHAWKVTGRRKPKWPTCQAARMRLQICNPPKWRRGSWPVITSWYLADMFYIICIGALPKVATVGKWFFIFWMKLFNLHYQLLQCLSRAQNMYINVYQCISNISNN